MRENSEKFEQLRTKFPSTTLGYPLVRISRLEYAFSGILELEPSPVEGQQLQQKDKKKRKRKGFPPPQHPPPPPKIITHRESL